MAKNHRAGRKIGGRHTTVIDASIPLIDFLQKHPLVTNIIFGRIKMGIGSAPQRLKFREESGCILITVRGSASVQEIRVFSKDLGTVVDDVQKHFRMLCEKNN